MTPTSFGATERVTGEINARDVLNAATSEAQLQQAVIELAERLGYTVKHVRDSRGQRWQDVPDLLCIRPARAPYAGRCVWLELKSQRGQLTAGQERMRDLLLESGAEVYSPVRPADVDMLAVLLAGWETS